MLSLLLLLKNDCCSNGLLCLLLLESCFSCHDLHRLPALCVCLLVRLYTIKHPDDVIYFRSFDMAVSIFVATTVAVHKPVANNSHFTIVVPKGCWSK